MTHLLVTLTLETRSLLDFCRSTWKKTILAMVRNILTSVSYFDASTTETGHFYLFNAGSIPSDLYWRSCRPEYDCYRHWILLKSTKSIISIPWACNLFSMTPVFNVSPWEETENIPDLPVDEAVRCTEYSSLRQNSSQCERTSQSVGCIP